MWFAIERWLRPRDSFVYPQFHFTIHCQCKREQWVRHVRFSIVTVIVIVSRPPGP